MSLPAALRVTAGHRAVGSAKSAALVLAAAVMQLIVFVFITVV
jgi:hypothetical protein